MGLTKKTIMKKKNKILGEIKMINPESKTSEKENQVLVFKIAEIENQLQIKREKLKR